MGHIQNSPKQIALKGAEQLNGLKEIYFKQIARLKELAAPIEDAEYTVIEEPTNTLNAEQATTFEANSMMADSQVSEMTNGDVIASIEPETANTLESEKTGATTQAVVNEVVDPSTGIRFQLGNDVNLEEDLAKINELLNEKLLEVILASSAASDLIDRQKEILAKLKAQGKEVSTKQVEMAESIVQNTDDLFAQNDYTNMSANIFDNPETGMTL